MLPEALRYRFLRDLNAAPWGLIFYTHRTLSIHYLRNFVFVMRILSFSTLFILCFACKKETTTPSAKPNFQYFDMFSSTLRAATVNASNQLFHFGYATNGLTGKLLIYDILNNKSFETSYTMNSSSPSNQCAASIGEESFSAVNAQYNGNTKYDPMLLCFDKQGQVTHTQVFSDTLSEVVQDLIATQDKNLLIFSIDGDNPTNVILRKCNTKGELIWTKYFKTSYYFYNSRIVELKNGKFAFFLGQVNSNATVLITADPTTNTVETTFFNFSVKTNQIRYMCKSPSGMITLASTINQKVWLASLDPESGEILWEQVHGMENLSINASAITALEDGTYALIAACFGNHTRNQDALFAHIDAAGKILNFKVFGGPSFDFPQHITAVGNNELFISGEYSGTNIFQNGRAMFVVRLKADGTFIQ